MPTSASDPGALFESAPAPDDVLSVSTLNRLARTLLEQQLPLLRITGEISNLVRAASGHVYFTLKDEHAQVRCTMWRSRAGRLAFRPDNGMQVEVQARPTLYETRGEFQLNVEHIRPGGAGSLYEAFVRLRDTLAAEGLFDPARKRALPLLPHTVGVVTSASGAAWQDVRATLARRAPAIRLVLYPAQVQGAPAPESLAQAVQSAAEHATAGDIAALLVVRGGGSIEDLWAFNDEQLARRLHAFPVPVVSGVGHETDFTIADFVADHRAATPTMAAELVSAGYVAAGERLTTLARALPQAMQRRLDTLAQRLDAASVRLIHPRERLQRSDEQRAALAHRLRLAFTHRLTHERARLTTANTRFIAARPALAPRREQVERLATTLAGTLEHQLQRRRERLATLASHLDHLSPDAVLERGFSITRNATGQILRSAADTAAGEVIDIELAHGRIEAEVGRRTR